MTPQVARIDAHLLNREGVARLCYCGTVLHTRPRFLTAAREPLQIGADIYGHAGIESDVEIQQLLRAALAACGLGNVRLDSATSASSARSRGAAGSVPSSSPTCSRRCWRRTGRARRAYRVARGADPGRVSALPELYGGAEVLDRAAALPPYPEIGRALADLGRLMRENGIAMSIDLADLRGYHYHSGVVFAAYGDGLAERDALGGRYDEVGKAFGRARPATGFSMDLRRVEDRTAGPAAGRDPRAAGRRRRPAGSDPEAASAPARPSSRSCRATRRHGASSAANSGSCSAAASG